MRPLSTQVPGLELVAEIGRGAGTVVYRARKGERSFALKVQRDTPTVQPPVAGASQFRKEAGVLARVRHPALPAILDVGEMAGRPYLVMEHVEGRTLASVLADGRLSQAALVRLAETLAGALAELHRHGLVHRDVKPQNILLDGAGDAKLVDFGFATRAAVAHGTGEAVGTFQYSAPEQAGVLRRPVDGRADLYALGAVLFECATGRPPFLAPDAGELIRQHAVVPAPDVRALNPTISPALAAMIAKLLAKDPDDRYQTGVGLLADLRALAALDAALGAGQTVVLGTSEDSAAALSESPLIGRDAELADLREHWQGTLSGQGTVVLVEGEAGSGKSRLVRELLHGVRSGGGLVLAGKCSDADPLPLAPLREAMAGWLRHLQHLPGPRRREAEGRIAAAARAGGPLLERFVPSLAPFLAEAPTAPAELADAQEQFYDAVAGFLLRLARAHAAAVLFVDDVQWLDHTSRQVLGRLARHVGDAPLLVVSTARNDAESAESLARFVADMGPALSTRLALAPLDEEAVGLMVAEHLGGHAVDRGLVRQIAVRSNGNPLALGEYVSAMLEAGLLRPSWGTWLVDTAGLERLQLPTDVVQLVVRRLAELDERTREILSVAAVLGSGFRLDLLLTVCGEPGPVHGAIAEATRAHLIEREEAGTYAFVHDRVQEALLSRLDAGTLRALHQRVAEALDRPGGDQADRIFALARHYALGEVDRHARRVYETNFAAGRKAVENYADEEAYAFLDQAYRSAAAGLAPDPALEEALSEVCARTGRWVRAMAHLEGALKRSTSPLQRARLRTRLAQVYMANRETAQAWREVEAAFAEIGVRSPKAQPLQLGSALWSWALGLLAIRSGFRAGGAAGEQRERLRLLAQLFAIAAEVAYLDNRFLPMVEMLLRSLRPAHRLGPSRELVTSYTGYALLLAVLKRPAAAERYGQRAVRLAEQLGDQAGLARGLAGYARAKHVGGAAREGEALLRSCLAEHGRWLDARDYVGACTDLGWSLLMRGYCREAWGWVQQAMRKAAHSSSQRLSLATDAAALLAVLGQPGEAREYLERAREVVKQTSSGRWHRIDFLGRATLVHLELEELGDPLEELLAQHRELRLRPGRAAFHSRHFYVFQAYARLAQCQRAEPASRPRRLAELREALGQLRAAAAGHPVLRCHQLTVEGALRRLEGRHERALRVLARAEAQANEADSPWAWFEIARQRAHTLAALGNQPAAMHQARLAHALAVEQGWANRARWVRAEFQLDPAPWRPTEPDRRRLSDPQHQKLQRHLDALLQVSLAAASVRDPAQQARVALDEIISVLGAERAFLFLCGEDGGEPVLQAGRDAEGHSLMELKGYSRTVVETVRASRQPLVVSGTQEGPVLASESIMAHDLRSIAAAPLLLRGRLVGVVYLDNRLARGVFTEDDLAILRAIASQIAIAAETADAFARQAALTLENARLLEALREQVEELQRSRRLITTAEERLRREIAELLHSRVQTKLVVAWHRLGQCQSLLATDPAEAGALLAAVRDQIDQIREQEVRQASHLLHPSIIRVGLVPAVRSLAQDFEEHLRVAVYADPELARLDGPVESLLPEELRLAAYRVVQEALGNVTRHAGATAVQISLGLTADRRLELVVRDDGRGFDAARLQPGLGLSSISARVGQVGGTWQLASAIGQGTRLSVLLPLDGARGDERLTPAS